MADVDDVCVVIGGTGLMGVPTCRKLVEKGLFKEVRVLSRGEGKGQGFAPVAPPPMPDGVKLVICDRSDKSALHEALRGASVVVDFVGQRPADIEGIVSFHRDVQKLRHYVFISTNMVYPGGAEQWDISRVIQPQDTATRDLDFTPLQPWKEDDARVLERAEVAPQRYGGHKLRCELALHRAREECGLPFTVLRPPCVIGVRCDSRWERLHRLAIGLVPLPALPPRDYNNRNPNPGALFQVVFADDVGEAVALAIKKGEPTFGEAFNLCQSEAQSLVDLVRLCQESVKGSRAASCVLPDPEVVAQELAGINFPSQGRLSTEKARSILGWSPTPATEFVETTAKWHETVMTVFPSTST